MSAIARSFVKAIVAPIPGAEGTALPALWRRGLAQQRLVNGRKKRHPGAVDAFQPRHARPSRRPSVVAIFGRSPAALPRLLHISTQIVPVPPLNWGSQHFFTICKMHKRQWKRQAWRSALQQAPQIGRARRSGRHGCVIESGTFTDASERHRLRQLTSPLRAYRGCHSRDRGRSL
jgi:hypothetical protein